MTNPSIRDLASPIPDPTPKPETGGKYGGLASGIPADPKAESKTEPTSESKPDADKASEPKVNRDGKVVADTKPVPDAAEKPDPKPDADGKAKPSAATRFMRAAGIPMDMPRHPIKGMSALVKAQWTAGADISEKLAGKLGAKGAMKTAARLVPGVGAAYSAIQAYQHAKSGDYLGAALNMIGAIPGPIGWVGIAAATAWDMFDLGGGKLGQWDQPDGSSTFILPAAASDIGGVTTLDSQLREAQRLVFSFQDGPTGRVWDSNPPEALRLDGADIEKEVTAALGGIADLFAEVDRVMSSAGEAYFDEYKARLQPHLDAMAALKEQIKPLMTQFSNASDGAATAYTAVLDANRAAREQLAKDSKLSDQGPATSFNSSVAAAGSKVIAADQNIATMFGEPAAVLTPAVATGTGTKVDPKTTEKPITTPAPVAQAPAAATPTVTPMVEPTQKKADDPLSELMKTLNQQKPVTTPSTPSVPNLGSGLGGGSPLGNTGGSPLSSSPSKPLTSDGDKKLEEPTKRKFDDKRQERKLEDPSKDKKEEKKPTPLSASQTDNKVTKPGDLTTTEKPGHPAVVPAQPAAANTNPSGAQAQPAPEASKEVDVKGNKTTFPDAKTAKMAQLLANADPAHPLSLTDAAAQAGLTPPVPGQDPGSQVAPAQAKPGDLLVSGDKKFMLLGDGKFYDLQEYKVVSADQLPQDAGSRGGYFHLNDPSPTGAPGTQPVSGQTAGVDQQVPGGTPPPAAPANASPAAPGAPGAPGAPAPAGGIPSAGTPGAPKPAAAGGPASAESTQTGTGQGQPSPSTTALDPSAVR